MKCDTQEDRVVLEKNGSLQSNINGFIQRVKATIVKIY